MPIYVYKCETCGLTSEALQPIGTNELDCSKCGVAMSKQPTCQSLVYMKGFPSFRRRYLGTAPYTPRVLSSEVKGGPGSKQPVAIMLGEKWLESLA